jgi:uncharacterized membrane protein YfcA
MTLTPTWPHAWLLIASLLAGALNAMAGGGSFLSFPAVLATGILPIQANATNTVALWPGQFASIAAYWEDLKYNLRLILPLGSAALVGGLAGGIVLLHTGQTTFLALIPWLLLVAALLFAASTPISKWLQRRSAVRAAARSASGASTAKAHPSVAPLVVGMIVVCFYIGYFGAGAGFLVMSVLAIFGVEDLNQINALKVVTTCLANGIAVITFIVERQVAWQYCLLMMVTAAIGGYFGGRYARRVNAKAMRAVVVILGLGMAGYFFWKQYRA